MNEEQKQRVAEFVAELRTTDKPQTTGYLNIIESACTCGHKPVGMCCLGVATERVPGIVKVTQGEVCSRCDQPFRYVEYGDDAHYGRLPAEAEEFYGFDDSLPIVRDHVGAVCRAHVMNDTWEKPFKVIGDAFARQYLDEDN